MWAFAALYLASLPTAEKTYLSQKPSSKNPKTKDVGLWELKISETFEIFPM